MPAHALGGSIEGERISGDSRDPIRFQRQEKVKGDIRYLFKANFNVHAEVKVVLPPASLPINENALTNSGETLGCDSAIIKSLDKKYSQQLVSHRSSTHSGNEWEFKQQTNVEIVTPRQDIINAQEKRKQISNNQPDTLLTCHYK